MSNVKQWKHDEQRALENEIISLREQVEKLTKERNEWMLDACPKLAAQVTVANEKLAVLAEQNEKMRAALRNVVDDAEECTDFDGWTAMLLSLDAYHIASTCLEEINDQTDLATPVLNRIKAEGMRDAAMHCSKHGSRTADEVSEDLFAKADELEQSK